MSKTAISVTLDSDNLVWLRGRAAQMGVRSVSELLDQLVRAAREGGGAGPVRSVVGTIDVAGSDPRLETADTALRQLFDASLRRPFVARERATFAARPLKRRRG